VVQHSSCSPNITSSLSDPSGSLKNSLWVQCYADNAAMQMEEGNFYLAGMYAFVRRWKNNIDNDGDYIKK
jgi:hypothetical protein